MSTPKTYRATELRKRGSGANPFDDTAAEIMLPLTHITQVLGFMEGGKIKSGFLPDFVYETRKFAGTITSGTNTGAILDIIDSIDLISNNHALRPGAYVIINPTSPATSVTITLSSNHLLEHGDDGTSDSLVLEKNDYLYYVKYDEDTSKHYWGVVNNTYGDATSLASGLMSASDKGTFDTIKGVSAGTSQDASGANTMEVISKVTVNNYGQVTAVSKKTLAAATPSDGGAGGTDGVMTAADKEKLNKLSLLTGKDVDVDFTNVETLKNIKTDEQGNVISLTKQPIAIANTDTAGITLLADVNESIQEAGQERIYDKALTPAAGLSMFEYHQALTFFETEQDANNYAPRMKQDAVAMIGGAYIYEETTPVTITFNTQGATQASEYVKILNQGDIFGASLPSVSKIGYNFDGWFTAASGGTEINTGTTVPSSATTYYAQWTAKTITVTFNKNTTDSTTGPTPATKTYTYDSYYTGLATISRAGYKFMGWYTSISGGSKVDDSVQVKRASSHHLYARWEYLDMTIDPSINISCNSPITETQRMQFTIKNNDVTTASITYRYRLNNLTWSSWTTVNSITAGDSISVVKPAFTVEEWTQAFSLEVQAYALATGREAQSTTVIRNYSTANCVFIED